MMCMASYNQRIPNAITVSYVVRNRQQALNLEVIGRLIGRGANRELLLFKVK
jgi:hypothetical protein